MEMSGLWALHRGATFATAKEKTENESQAEGQRVTITNNTDYAGIKGALIAWIDSVLGGDKTRWENTDFPRLAKPYATFLIAGMGSDQGLDEVTEVLNGAVIETTYTGNRSMTLRLRIYGDPPGSFAGIWPQELMQTALLTLHTQALIDDFRVAAIAFISHTPVVEADVQEGDRWEWIAECDLTISYRTVLFDDGLGAPPDDGQYIESVELDFNSEPTWTIDSTP